MCDDFHLVGIQVFNREQESEGVCRRIEFDENKTFQKTSKKRGKIRLATASFMPLVYLLHIHHILSNEALSDITFDDKKKD